MQLNYMYVANKWVEVWYIYDEWNNGNGKESIMKDGEALQLIAGPPNEAHALDPKRESRNAKGCYSYQSSCVYGVLQGGGRVERRGGIPRAPGGGCRDGWVRYLLIQLDSGGV